ncbi:hypothetical protein BDZ45DRAFT_691135 [Acephala macrosclerotiorum]|nr:hypothetical protein BDZ45DRAFT_691135 [Acephala macrosclerotiorum]
MVGKIAIKIESRTLERSAEPGDGNFIPSLGGCRLDFRPGEEYELLLGLGVRDGSFLVGPVDVGSIRSTSSRITFSSKAPPQTLIGDLNQSRQSRPVPSSRKLLLDMVHSIVFSGPLSDGLGPGTRGPRVNHHTHRIGLNCFFFIAELPSYHEEAPIHFTVSGVLEWQSRSVELPPPISRTHLRESIPQELLSHYRPSSAIHLFTILTVVAKLNNLNRPALGPSSRGNRQASVTSNPNTSAKLKLGSR